MKVTFDSNVWETIFNPVEGCCSALRAALTLGRVEGFICEAAFRIEAVRKSQRATYFAQPAMSMQVPGTIVEIDGKPHICIASFGPDDQQHPGLPEIQAQKLRSALASGVRLLRGMSWMGLPSPKEICDPQIFVVETKDAMGEREQRQINIYARMQTRAVGKAAFDAAGGWGAPHQGTFNEKKFRKACAEWADGELVAAHIAYQNDILCTEDHANATGTSIFDPTSRAWLSEEFGVQFATLRELVERVAA